jgi:hemolysin activation/secretion protein
MNSAYAHRATKPTASLLLTGMLLALPGLAAAAPTAPDAGSLLQQAEPLKAPAPAKSETGLEHHQEQAGAAESSVAFEVRKIQISGNTLFDTATLHALVADAEGKTLDLAQLQALAKRITDYYHAHGYSLSRAILPAQTIQSGMVRIEVLEAQFGKLNYDNHSRLDDGLLAATFSPLQSGKIIGDRDIERALLLLSDTPGVKPTATLKPGGKVGTADMDVNVQTTGMYSGQVVLDNYGNAYTGRGRLGANLGVAEPFRHGDALSISVLTTGSDMNYGRLAYDTLLNGSGTRLGVSYSALDYSLGGSLADLQSHGTANVGSISARQPFIRSRALNLFGQLQYEHKELRDHVDASSIRTDRHLDNWVATLSGDSSDGLLAGGYNAWNLALTVGRVGFDDAGAEAADAATAHTAGGYGKLNAGYVRLQGLGSSNSLYLSLSGQWSGKNLDSSAKMVAGGPYTVRAYDMGVLSGDTGYLGTVEFRHQVSRQWQIKAFVDSEHITINSAPWTTGTNSATLSGAGLGVDWSGSDQWHAGGYVAARIGSIPSLLASASSARAWFQVSKAF